MTSGDYIDLGNPVADHPLTRGLVAWWLPLPNNAGGSRVFNITSHGRDAVLTSGPTWSGAFGEFRAIKFDGTDDHLLASVASSVTAYSFAFRIRAAAPSTANIKHALQYGTTNDSFGFTWNHTNAAFEQAAYHQDNGSTYRSAKLTSTLNAQQDYWVGATWDGSNNLKVYLNGKLEATTTGNATVKTVAGSVAWSARPGSNALASSMTDWVEWNRELSASEMWRWYDQSIRNHPDTLRRYSRRVYSFPSFSAATAVPVFYRHLQTQGIA